MQTCDLCPVIELGEISFGSGAREALSREFDVDPALIMHGRGFWGEQDDGEWVRNDRAVKKGQPVVSVFHSSRGIEFRILTNGARSKTWILLAEESLPGVEP